MKVVLTKLKLSHFTAQVRKQTWWYSGITNYNGSVTSVIKYRVRKPKVFLLLSLDGITSLGCRDKLFAFKRHLCYLIAARNAVTVLLAGGASAICMAHHIRPFSASNNMPAGLPPFRAPKFTIEPPLANRTYTTDEIFSVRQLTLLYANVDCGLRCVFTRLTGLCVMSRFRENVFTAPEHRQGLQKLTSRSQMPV